MTESPGCAGDVKTRVFIPPLNSKLRKYWPNGVIGVVTHENELNVHLRVKLRGHCEKEPHTAIIVADWKNVTDVE
jgi:hypothetical protein